MASFSRLKDSVFSREQRKRHFQDSFAGLNAFDRHKKFVNDYVKFYGQGSDSTSAPTAVKTDHDVLRESYRFIRTEEDDADGTWEQRLAKRYYDKLFKEYCLADMSRYRESKIGLRWRTQKEVLAGKGQFVCGAKGCEERAGLHSFEVNFGYVEAGQRKQALVKLRVCPKHATQLNYRKEKEIQKQQREESEHRKKRRRKEQQRSSRGGGSSEVSEEDKGAEEEQEEGIDAAAEMQQGKNEAVEEEDGKNGNEGGFEVGRGSREESDPKSKARGTEDAKGTGESAWAAKAPEVELTRDDEFDQYFQDLLL